MRVLALYCKRLLVLFVELCVAIENPFGPTFAGLNRGEAGQATSTSQDHSFGLSH